MEDNYIKSVDPTSPLHGKVSPGDTITAINGNEILDVLDYKFFAYDPRLTVLLRREDCKGLCPSCGKNLNLGPCACRKPVDPRFAVLEQLLDK